MKVPLTQADYTAAAERLGCDVAAIHAVADVEAPMGGFIDDVRPTILFERHIFSKITNGVYDEQHPSISNKKPGGYVGGTGEHNRLRAAAYLNRRAALMSCSWGKFQIMGFNYAQCGFEGIQEFVNAMYQSEQAQLRAFTAFLMRAGMLAPLRERDWSTFALLYNGPNYRKNRYDEKLREAYLRRRGHVD